MSTKSNEQLKKLDEKILQLKKQKQAISKREKAKKQKERDRRLIQYGELLEKYFIENFVDSTQKENFNEKFKELAVEFTRIKNK